MLEEEILKYLSNTLSKERLNHSIGTMKKCEELAIKLNENVEKARLVGLAHDIAKEFSKEQIFDYVKKNNIELDEIELNNLKLVHGKIGAHLTKSLFNFDDEMCTAISYHTTGKANMNMLTKILFISDLIEENRTYPDVDYLRSLTDKDLDSGIIYALNCQIKKCIEKGVLLHINTINARNYLVLNNNNKII